MKALAGGVEVNGVASWNGSHWAPLGSGLAQCGHPMGLMLSEYNGALVVEGTSD